MYRAECTSAIAATRYCRELFALDGLEMLCVSLLQVSLNEADFNVQKRFLLLLSTYSTAVWKNHHAKHFVYATALQSE